MESWNTSYQSDFVLIQSVASIHIQYSFLCHLTDLRWSLSLDSQSFKSWDPSGFTIKKYQGCLFRLKVYKKCVKKVLYSTVQYYGDYLDQPNKSNYRHRHHTKDQLWTVLLSVCKLDTFPSQQNKLWELIHILSYLHIKHG